MELQVYSQITNDAVHIIPKRIVDFYKTSLSVLGNGTISYSGTNIITIKDKNYQLMILIVIQ